MTDWAGREEGEGEGGSPSLSVSDASDLWCVKERIMVAAHMSYIARREQPNSESNKVKHKDFWRLLLPHEHIALLQPDICSEHIHIQTS